MSSNKVRLRSGMRDPPIGFTELMELEQIDEAKYRSLTSAFQPGGHFRPPGSTRAFGGHIFAQAVWAAAHTVPTGMVVHSTTGFFTAMGNTTLPFVYTVSSVRTGKSYCVRSVTATQETAKRDVCFTCTASFKKPEKADQTYQVPKPNCFDAALKGLSPEEHPNYLSSDESFFTKLRPEQQNDPRVAIPGLEGRKVDMKAYNAPLAVNERRQLSFYRTRDRLPSFQQTPNLHACAIIYATDVASLLSCGPMLGIKSFQAMASLVLTVIFHNTDEALNWTGVDGRRKWLFKEEWTDREADCRLVHHSRLWSEDGRHIGTTLQDGMIRGVAHEGIAKSNM